MKIREHHATLPCLLLCLSIVLGACATGGMPHGLVHKARPKIVIQVLERKIHDRINAIRRSNGLQMLSWDDSLAAIARNHSKDMAKRAFFDHVSPEGRDFSYRYRTAGYGCSVKAGSRISLGAENIALNHLYDRVTTVGGEAFYDWNSADRIAETTVKGWMDSPGHRTNIMTPYFLNEGIGIYIGPDDAVYITQNFC